ncbi:uncharacterized protein LOC141631530 [Silene latifolia]|uniref:uncharacterized protein LOC141631530 n=1 Tax=Silene latifolia TaxID=37657 RepID=UPI003D76E41B
MLKKREQPVYEGSKMSLLQSAARLLTLKCEFNMPHKCVDGFASYMRDMIPNNNCMTRNFYETKKVLKALQLPHQKIHACPTGCMLFWNDDHQLEQCKKCGADRYKSKSNLNGKRVPENPLFYFPIGPRLQRLYANKDIAAQMRWHYENPRANGIMSHPSDGEAWKHFDKQHPDFANDPRNRQFIFLSLIISGPKNPKKNLDIYLQPLVQELKDLWKNGLLTYDVSRKQNFDMRAALLWTINDFPAYGMLSGWTTAGQHACPYCLVNECKSFCLKHSKKWSWFDCHRQFLLPDHVFRKDNKHFRKDRPVEADFASTRLTGEEVWEHVQHLPSIVDATDEELLKLKKKREGWWKRSIFWDLPYWKTLLIRHNLDVMHIEKNFFEQMIHTIMDEKNKTSFKPNAQKDFKLICKARRKGDMIVLKKEEKRVLCNWICSLKFPDGYAPDLSRCVDLKDLRLHGMKSHDCHVFMERLLPVALKHLLPKNEWCAITEISQFFRDVCASTLQIDDMTRLENNIAEIMCKLEKIFPPSFFNSMEHLPVHLPYEAKVGGPVQYRWMYPFERFLNHLKRKIGNKARVEGSICNAYLLEEISNFCSLYYEKHIDTKAKQLDVCDEVEPESNLPELFQDHMGKPSGKCHLRYLVDKEYQSAHMYILSNCEKMNPYET